MLAAPEWAVYMDFTFAQQTGKDKTKTLCTKWLCNNQHYFHRCNWVSTSSSTSSNSICLFHAFFVVSTLRNLILSPSCLHICLQCSQTVGCHRLSKLSSCQPLVSLSIRSTVSFFCQIKAVNTFDIGFSLHYFRCFQLNYRMVSF